MTIIKVIKPSHPYLQIDKTGINDERLSWKARGLLVYLLSKPANWEISIKQLIKASEAEGRQAVQSGLKELEACDYLVRYPARDEETGRLQGWKSFLFSTPEACQYWKQEQQTQNNQEASKDSFTDERETRLTVEPTDGKTDERETRPTGNPIDGKTVRRENRQSENRPLINNEDLIKIDFNNSPLTPHEEEEREESQNAIVSNLFASEQTSSDSLVSKKSSNEDNFSAAIVKKNEEDSVKKCEEKTLKKDEGKFKNPTETISAASGSPFVMFQQPSEASSPSPNLRRYDSALGIRPPEEWKTLQQRRFNWVSEGPWLIDGKLDSNFVDWQAQEWQKSYGGSIHKKRGDVLRHFKKDPANLVIAWEQYRSEHLHRYENAAVRMQNGLEIKPEEQQQLLAHSRAVSQPLPEEMNPVASRVAVGSFIALPSSRSEEREVVDIPAEVVDFSKASVSLREVVETPIARDVCGGDGSLSSFKNASDLPRVEAETLTGRDVWHCNQGSFSERTQELGNSPETNSFQAPEQAENPAAYRQWQAKPIEDEPVCVEQFQALFASFSQGLSMRVKEGKHRQSEVSELDELNQWLADPILRREVMPRVIKSDRYTLDFDDYGSPLRVVEMK